MGDARVGRFRKKFPVYVYQNISACLKERQGVGATILICCAIDTLAKYALANSIMRGNKTQYIQFLSKYFPAKYDSEAFYKFVRCGLVHSFDMDKHYAILCCKDQWAQNLHMKSATGLRRTIINPYNLFRHLKKAHLQLCDELDNNKIFRRQFVRMYKNIPVRPQHYRREQVMNWLGIVPKKQKETIQQKKEIQTEIISIECNNP
jgi:hypothetical protein